MMASASPYSVPHEPGRWRALAMAVFVHALLFAFLWVGIKWVSDKPESVEAEVWSPQELDKAPPPPVEAPPPPPPPVVKEQPQPEVKEIPQENPEIALEQIKKKRLAEEKAEKERRAQEKKKTEAQAAAEKVQADKAAQRQAADVKRIQDAKDAKLRQLQHAEDMKRITGELTSTSTSGTSIKSQGSQLDAGWTARVKAKIKSNTHFPGTSETNAPVEYEVRLLPDGSVAGNPRMTKSSGIPEFDEAVRRAIEASQPFPSDSSGSVPPNITISHRPREQ
jgi:colicin import membrane protein